MCGIAGILKIHTPGDHAPGSVPHPLEVIPEAWLDILDESIKHRGPDGAGRFRDRAVRPDGAVVDIALVHRRLSIIDHAGGHQPMVHDGTRLRPDLTYAPGDTPILAHEAAPGVPLVTVVFNGCIYNHRELRAELEVSGRWFETDHSDTEVLLHICKDQPDDFLDRLFESSMFSFAFWNRSEGRCMVGRDLFGQKPLYIGFADTTCLVAGVEHPTHFNFSSSAIPLGHADAPKIINPIGVWRWITFGHHNAATPFETSLEASEGQAGSFPFTGQSSPTKLDRFFSFLADFAPVSSSEEPSVLPKRRRLLPRAAGSRAKDRAEDIDALILQSVSEKLESDVPIACLLSGGVDSSLIAAHAQHAAGKIRTISVRMPDPRFDESEYAAAVAKHIGSDHIVVEVGRAAAEDLITLVETSGLPFGDSSLLPTYWACRAASEHAQVVLTGDGGDELFVGYQRYFAATKIEKYWFLAMPPAMVFPTALVPARNPRGNGAKLRRLIEALRRCSYETLLGIFTPSESRQLLGRSAPKFPWFDAEEDPFVTAQGDLDFMLPSDYLRKVDLASMCVPIETRAPLLDRRIGIACYESRELLAKGGPKALLRRIASHHVPEHIINRPKQGFAIPIGEWFRTDYGGLRQLLHDHLRSADPFPGLADAGVHINIGFVERMLKEHDAAGAKSVNPWHGRDHSQRLYMLLVLSIWAKWLERVRRRTSSTTD